MGSVTAHEPQYAIPLEDEFNGLIIIGFIEYAGVYIEKCGFTRRQKAGFLG